MVISIGCNHLLTPRIFSFAICSSHIRLLATCHRVNLHSIHLPQPMKQMLEKWVVIKHAFFDASYRIDPRRYHIGL